VFVLTLIVLAPLVHGTVFGAGNDASRFALIESLVDRGTTTIESSRYRWTVDQVLVDGRVYSNKPPLLSLAGALPYAVMERLFGLSLETHEEAVLYLLNLLLVAVPTALLCALFHRSLVAHWGPESHAGLVTATLAAGTILTSFSTTLNNHTVAAALLFAAFDAALFGRSLAAGAWLGLTVCVDIVPGLLFVPALGAALYTQRKGEAKALRPYALALAGGAVLFVAADLFTTGSFWPAKMAANAHDYSSSTGAAVAGVLLPNSWNYPLEALFGWHGFFSVSPVLLFGAGGLLRSVNRDSPLPRRVTRLVGMTCAVMIAAHIIFVGSYGGWSYGFRYLIPIIPVLLFYAPAALGTVGRRVYVPVLAFSCLTALLGAYNPWPPADEPGTGRHPVASVVTNPVGGNLAAWLVQMTPGTLADEAARFFISTDPDARRQYLRLFYASRGDVLTMQRIPPGVPKTP
jgi:hypothetical protein